MDNFANNQIICHNVTDFETINIIHVTINNSVSTHQRYIANAIRMFFAILQSNIHTCYRLVIIIINK